MLAIKIEIENVEDLFEQLNSAQVNACLPHLNEAVTHLSESKLDHLDYSKLTESQTTKLFEDPHGQFEKLKKRSAAQINTLVPALNDDLISHLTPLQIQGLDLSLLKNSQFIALFLKGFWENEISKKSNP